MTLDELRFRFPRASDDFIRANLSLGSSGKNPVVELRTGPEPLAAGEAQKEDCSRFLVRIASIRKRLLDEDNLCSKYHTDLCRYSGILPSDAPERCQIQVSQRKAKKGEAEQTEITVYKIT